MPTRKTKPIVTIAPANFRFFDAERYNSRKVAMTRVQYDALREEVKMYAFTVARVTSAQVVQRVQRAVTRALIDGTTLETFRKEVAWLDLSDAHIETIFRTNVQLAYGAGQLHQLRQMTNVFPYWQYLAINDSRVRPEHFALNGKIYPANHPFWRLHYPPWDFNCRCDVVPMTADQVGDRTIWTDSGPGVENGFLGPGAVLGSTATRFSMPVIYPRKLSGAMIREIEMKLVTFDGAAIDEGPAAVDSILARKKKNAKG